MNLPPRAQRYRGIRILEVVRAEQVTPGMRRLVLGGAEMEDFGTGPNVKLLIPPPGLAAPEWPLLGADGQPDWPAPERRPAVRTYSVRHVDRARSQLWVDFALYAAPGPAADFARRARPGDLLGVGGPGGRALPAAGFHILAGDHSGLPSIAAILASLAPDARGCALLEVDDAAEEQALAAPPGFAVRYLHRDGAPAGTTRLLEQAVRMLQVPQGLTLSAWVATESAAARALRAHLRDERGLGPRALVSVGYWKRGMSESDYHAAHDHDRDADYHRASREEEMA